MCKIDPDQSLHTATSLSMLAISSETVRTRASLDQGRIDHPAVIGHEPLQFAYICTESVADIATIIVFTPYSTVTKY